MARRLLYLSMIFLLSVHAAAAQENEYRITYTIAVGSDGTAEWHVEYRTPLVSREDFDAFENYTDQLKSVYLKEFKELMGKSVSDAQNVTARKMMAGGFTGDASIQTAPTGSYGVVRFSFTWTNFAKLDSNGNLVIGDVFAGGLYLSKDNTLIIQYPSGYTIEKTTPQPDQIRDGLVWYGLRSFNPGEPAVSLIKTPTTWVTYAIVIFVIFIIAAYTYLRKARADKAAENVAEPIAEPVAEILTTEDMMDLEERIVKILKESGGSLYQSEIGRKLNLPKSTVSSALNGLHNKNIIHKIKKGRENLIRLV